MQLVVRCREEGFVIQKRLAVSSQDKPELPALPTKKKA